MAKQTPRKGMQLFDADEALLGMIAGARGGTIVVGGRHIPKAAIARVTQHRVYLKPEADWAGAAFARPARPPTRVRRGRCPASGRTRP